MSDDVQTVGAAQVCCHSVGVVKSLVGLGKSSWMMPSSRVKGEGKIEKMADIFLVSK